MKEKHLPYFEVLDSFKSKECPICFLIKDRVEKYFDNLLYENINDIGFREKFRENHGFCNYHSYKFLSYNDGLAISLTHKELLINVIEKIKVKCGTSHLTHNKKDKCIICELAKEEQERYISVITEYLTDQEFKNKFLSSEGLCIPHLELLLAKIKTPLQWFIDFQIKKLEEVLTKLDKYIDSCNFSSRNKHSLTYEEQLIWKKVVKILFGFEGMFR